MKKVAFVDHSYHVKTKSSLFMIQLLERHYQVEVILNDQWKDEQEPDVSDLDERYYAVIFWQSISYQLVEKTKCPNKIFFPMYDDSGGLPDCFWKALQGVKFISFSKALSCRLRLLGLPVIYVQYYPQAASAILAPLDGISVFFWQRRDDINWNMVRGLLGDNPCVHKVHIHRSVDPGQHFVRPTVEDERRYSITYSDWFADKKDYLACVQACNVYIAPRLYEGIGFSFLEAMAMGQVVIAADRPVMNEYIVNGVNGYLFDPENIQSIPFSNLCLLQENAYNGIRAGRGHWQQEENRMLAFIDLPVDMVLLKNSSVCSGSLVATGSWQTLKEYLKQVLPSSILRGYRFFKHFFRGDNCAEK